MLHEWLHPRAKNHTSNTLEKSNPLWLETKKRMQRRPAIRGASAVSERARLSKLATLAVQTCCTGCPNWQQPSLRARQKKVSPRKPQRKATRNTPWDAARALRPCKIRRPNKTIGPPDGLPCSQLGRSPGSSPRQLSPRLSNTLHASPQAKRSRHERHRSMRHDWRNCFEGRYPQNQRKVPNSERLCTRACVSSRAGRPNCEPSQLNLHGAAAGNSGDSRELLAHLFR